LITAELFELGAQQLIWEAKQKSRGSYVGATTTTQGRKPKAQPFSFVGSSPGDLGLPTSRATAGLANAGLEFTGPDLPEPALAPIGKDLPSVSSPMPTDPVAANAEGVRAGDRTRRAATRRGFASTAAKEEPHALVAIASAARPCAADCH
jgi:uroporphyrinogen III methyltransferase/synthase